MKLSEILSDLTGVELHGAADAEIESLTYDSRRVRRGDCFFAVEGVCCDGHDYIPAAVAAGASAVVCRLARRHI